jgi:hypothetical protein
MLTAVLLFLARSSYGRPIRTKSGLERALVKSGNSARGTFPLRAADPGEK